MTPPSTTEDFCAIMRSFVGSPAYHQILSSPHLTGKLGPISERDFYLALRYFPRRFTAIHERLLTQLCAVLVRCERILRRTSPQYCTLWLDNSLPSSPLSLGTLARLTIPLAQRALGSQVRATLTVALTELTQYQCYYRQAHLLHTPSPSPSPSDDNHRPSPYPSPSPSPSDNTHCPSPSPSLRKIINIPEITISIIISWVKIQEMIVHYPLVINNLPTHLYDRNTIGAIT